LKVLTLEGNIVDVRKSRIFPGKISIEDSVITTIEETDNKYETYLAPGFIDGHIHIESSMLCPSRFAEAVLPHGTTAVVADPHEIANVMGISGIDYMVKDAAKSPLNVFFTAPSCVPATPFETAGAEIGPREIEELLKRPEVVALGEMMNFPGVINDVPEVIAKLDAAKKAGKPIDGHAPMLTMSAPILMKPGKKQNSVCISCSGRAAHQKILKLLPLLSRSLSSAFWFQMTNTLKNYGKVI
jgi:adenine deaminase